MAIKKPLAPIPKEPIQDYKGLFEHIVKMKDSALSAPSEDITEESIKWYEEFGNMAYREMTHANERSNKVKARLILNSMPDYGLKPNRIGSMYTFVYHASTGDQMPYWDRFPLIIKITDESDSRESFQGVNLHYLSPLHKRLLVMSLMGDLSGLLTAENSRVVGMGIRKLMRPANKYGRVCIRRYRYDNMYSKAIRIPPEHWMKVIYLPTYQFLGSRIAKVWADSTRAVNKLKGI
jgi:hypothetical protein